jgi:hypothetical protein
MHKIGEFHAFCMPDSLSDGCRPQRGGALSVLVASRSHRRLLQGYDKPKLLAYSICPVCLAGAGGERCVQAASGHQVSSKPRAHYGGRNPAAPAAARWLFSVRLWLGADSYDQVS